MKEISRVISLISIKRRKEGRKEECIKKGRQEEEEKGRLDEQKKRMEKYMRYRMEEIEGMEFYESFCSSFNGNYASRNIRVKQKEIHR